MSEKINIYETVGEYTLYSLLATRGLVIMPGTKVSFDVGRKISNRAVEAAMSAGRMMVISSQKDISDDEPDVDSIYRIGTLVKVKQVLRISDDTTRILVKGIERVRISQIYKEGGYYKAVAVKIKAEDGEAGVREQAMMRMLRNLFDQYCDLAPKPADDAVTHVMASHTLGELTDVIVGYTFMSYENKQTALEISDPYERAEYLAEALTSEIDILKVEREIAFRVKEQIDTNQREFYLKEQLKAIQGELGGVNLLMKILMSTVKKSKLLMLSTLQSKSF